VLCPNPAATQIFQSKRNRDDKAIESVSEIAPKAPPRDVLTLAGISPGQLGTGVTDAIVNDRFWILSPAFTPAAAS